MATVLDELLVKLGFDADASGADFFDSKLGSIIGTAAKVSAAIGGTAIVVAGGMAKMAYDSANATDEAARLADVANVTTQELQRMTAGTERHGISQEKLADILKDVGDKVGDFMQTGGGPMADFFDNIGPKVGVTAEQFKNLSSKDALQLYVDSLEKANVSQAEMQFFMEAIASDATMLLPLLENGGEGFKKWGDEAEKAGRVMSDIDIANAQAMVDNIEKAKGVYKGLLSQMGARVTPYINQALEWVIAHESDIKATADAMADAFDIAIDAIGTAYEYVADKIQWLDDNSQQIKSTLLTIGIIAGIVAGALALMYGPTIAGFIAMRVIALTSFLVMQAGAIASALATAAAWAVAFAPFLLVAALVAAAIYSFWWLYQNWDMVTAYIKQAWDNFVVSFNMGVERIKAWWNGVVSAISAWWSGVMDSISGAFSTAIGFITDVWSGFWDGAKSVAMGVLDAIIGAISSIVTSIGNAIGKAKDLAKYTPAGLAVNGIKWAAGKLGIGGGGGNTTNINQTINAASAADATNIANNTLSGRRSRNTGVVQ